MEELISSITVPNSSRGRERLARILDAATELFLRDGYGATSIDAILDVSGGSKATLYNYFPTKDDLFRAVIDEVLSSTHVPKLDTGADPKSTLVEFLTQRLEAIFSTRHHALLRLIIAERERFPDLARMYYERGPMQTRSVLSDYFVELERRGVLDPGTPREAAEFLTGMLAHWWIIEVLLLGGSPTQEAIRDRVVRVVDRFLAAFARRPRTV
ncbi:MAG TPA: TetR/AcrR family transcriptional regulator [Gammaproteobacteria bacterium]